MHNLDHQHANKTLSSIQPKKATVVCHPFRNWIRFTVWDSFGSTVAPLSSPNTANLMLAPQICPTPAGSIYSWDKAYVPLPHRYDSFFQSLVLQNTTNCSFMIPPIVAFPISPTFVRNKELKQTDIFTYHCSLCLWRKSVKSETPDSWFKLSKQSKCQAKTGEQEGCHIRFCVGFKQTPNLLAARCPIIVHIN